MEESDTARLGLGQFIFLVSFLQVYLHLVDVIDHFTVVCSVTRPLNGSEAGGDLVVIQTSLLLLCKSRCLNADSVRLDDKAERPVSNQGHLLLTAIQRPDHQADNCKMVYSISYRRA